MVNSRQSPLFSLSHVSASLSLLSCCLISTGEVAHILSLIVSARQAPGEGYSTMTSHESYSDVIFLKGLQRQTLRWSLKV